MNFLLNATYKRGINTNAMTRGNFGTVIPNPTSSGDAIKQGTTRSNWMAKREINETNTTTKNDDAKINKNTITNKV